MRRVSFALHLLMGESVRFLYTTAVLVSGLLLSTGVTRADERLDAATSACQSVDDCLNSLYDWSRTYNGRVEDVAVAVTNLKRFGNPMRDALLDRATGSDRRLSQLSDVFLNAWHGWTPSDVPALARALSVNPGGMVARSLGEVGTPEAMQALADDMRRGAQGQSDYALGLLGARAVPYLFPLLEDAQFAPGAARVITAMGEESKPFAESWALLAADPRQPTAVRLGALRGLAALGRSARQWTGDLHVLLTSQDQSLRATAANTLLATGDSAVLDTLLEQCRPKDNELEFVELGSTSCLRHIESLGHDAVAAGPKLTPFLDSPNADERLGVVTTLGVIGDVAAIPRLRGALRDLDWRVVYAATKSLGQLRAVEATEDLEGIYDTYWLPEVRRQARYSLTDFKLPADSPTPYDQLEADRKSGGFPYDLYSFVLDDIPACSSQQWRLKSLVIHFPERGGSYAPRTVSARLSNGRGFLQGSNGGEFGSALTWKPHVGPSKVVYQGYEVIGIFPDGDGAIAVIGLAHLGIDFSVVVSLDLGAGGRWTLHEVARLPSMSSAMVQVSPGVYAARSGHRVTVFNRTQILGLGTCSEELSKDTAASD